MKYLITIIFIFLNGFLFSQLQKEVDPFTKSNISYVDKNYTLLSKMVANVQISRAERIQTDSIKFFYRIYIKIYLNTSFCFDENGGIVLLKEDDTQLILSPNSTKCSTIKCGGGQCTHLIVLTSKISAQDFFGLNNKRIKAIRLNTTNGFSNFEIDSERYQTNFSRLVENFSEFENDIKSNQ